MDPYGSSLKFPMFNVIFWDILVGGLDLDIRHEFFFSEEDLMGIWYDLMDSVKICEINNFGTRWL